MPTSSETTAHLQYAARFVVLAVAYYIVGRLGLDISAVGGVAAPVWPASGIALAALVVWSPRLWPAIALASLGVYLAAGVPALAAAAMALGNTAEATLAAAWTLRQRKLVSGSWGSLGETLAFVGFAAFSTTLLSASVGVIAASVAGIVPRESFALAFRSWWIGDALGMLLVGPFLLTLRAWRHKSWSHARTVEALCTTITLVALGMAVFASEAGQRGPHAYLVVAPLLWAALRFRQPGATSGLLLIGIIAVFGTVRGLGPFAVSGDAASSLFTVQTFMVTMALTTLCFGAVSAERIESAAALEREHAFARAILDAAGLLVVLDTRGKVVRRNHAYEHLFLDAGSAGGDFWESLAPESRQETRGILAEIVRTRHPATWESRCASKLGERVIIWSATPLLDEHGQVAHIIASGNDVTDRRQLETQLLAADRLSAMGRLAAGVGHEINNPLAYTMMSIELAQRVVKRCGRHGASEQAELEELLGTAFEGADRVRHIVGDLRALARVDDVRGPTEVHRVLETSLSMAWNEIRHRAHLIRDYNEVPLVDANEGRLGQVFLNLLINAAQAIPEGRAVDNTIRVRTGTDAEGRVVIEVSDTGVGVQPELLGRVFEPFFTTKPMGAGVGLGLSVCHAIVTSFAGQITIDSEPGKGTTFRVTLPASTVSEARAPAPPALRSLGSPGRLDILIVDDEPELARSLVPFLDGHHIELASSGREALARCLEKEFDLLLCDLLMPEMTGMDLYAELVRLRPGSEQRMVFMTGGAFTARAQEFLAQVQNQRLDKPFASHQLLAVVSAAARGKGRRDAGVIGTASAVEPSPRRVGASKQRTSR